MKTFDLNELLAASLKGAMANHKQESPPWFMIGQSNFNGNSHISLFESLISQLIQYSIFQGKTVYRSFLYMPDNSAFHPKELDESTQFILNNFKNLKLIFKSEFQGAVFISQEDILNFNASNDRIEIASLNNENIKSLKEKLSKIGKK